MRLSGFSALLSGVAVAVLSVLPASGAESRLHDSGNFVVTGDRVIEGPHEARALSATELRSHYMGVTRHWRASLDVSAFPAYRSPHLLIDALYRLSLEEVLLNIRADGAFMAGKEWTGVWTRDISYAILLALAAIDPEGSKRSLMAKVRNGAIVQDTGTGGSWPVSTDRMTWALAAWEVYAVTGDPDWLSQSFAIIVRSAEADLAAAHDPVTGLFFGESSFLDWREQSYPRWMDPKDIYKSQALGANAVHYETYRILARMARALGKPDADYDRIADAVRDGVNAHFWQPDKGYYGQYRYGRLYLSLSPRSETLGSALSVLFGIASPAQSRLITENLPVTDFGAPIFYPQIPGIPPYHNDGIWPFVQAYWTWAAAKAGNAAAVEHGLAALYRAAALFLTNKENMVAGSGHYDGTEINSDRQLWSVAGNLAMVYRVLYGMEFRPDGVAFSPFVPAAYSGLRRLEGFRYRDAVLSITLEGHGSGVAAITLDGEPLARPFIPAGLKGAHDIAIRLDGDLPESRFAPVANRFSPGTPQLRMADGMLSWDAVAGAVGYQLYRNGQRIAVTSDRAMAVGAPAKAVAEYQLAAVDALGLASFLSAPVRAEPQGMIQRVAPLGGGPVRLTRAGGEVAAFQIDAVAGGRYAIDVRYANGNGPINTDSKAAIRTLYLNGERAGVIVMPQRGVDAWDDRGYSSPLAVSLGAGENRIELRFTASDENMDGAVNEAIVEHLRLTRLGG